MTNPENMLYFPKLGLEFYLESTAFSIFGYEIKWYGILIGLGFLLAMIYAFANFKKVGLDETRTLDVLICSFISAIIGARLYFVIYEWDSYKGNFGKIFAIHDGGLAIYGGIIGGLLMAIIVSKIRKVKIMPLFDLAGIGFLIGQTIGRWGNFVNHEAFGENTDNIFGMTSIKIQNYLAYNAPKILETTGVVVDPTAPVHPCFLYESFWCLIGFLILNFYFKHRKFDGEIFLLYVTWYGIGRFFIEGLRTDSLMIGTMRVSQILAAVSVVAAIAAIVYMRLKIKKDGSYTFYKDTEESKLLIAEGEAEKSKKQIKDEAELTAGQKIIDDDDEDLEEDTTNIDLEDENDGE